jgi:hypothetical protein
LYPDRNNPAQPGHSRVVIQLDRQQPGVRAAGLMAPRNGRVWKILAILVAIIVLIVLCFAGGAFLWWQHYKTTPAYALALLVDAAQRNDMEGVDKIIDTDKIVDNFTAEVIDKAAGRYGAALSGAARKQIESLAPKVLPIIKQKVRDGVAARVKEISEGANHKPFIVIALGLPYVVNIATEGDTAKATTVVREQKVELDLQRRNDGWTVVAVHDDALVQKMIDEVIKELPAVGGGDETQKHQKKSPLGLPNIRLP